MSLSDRETVERIQRGDLQFFSVLIAKHRASAYAAAFARLGNHDDAHDAVQEAFIDAYLGLAHLRDSNKFRAWLMTILNRRCLRILHTRREQAQLLSESEEPAVNPSSSWACSEHDVSAALSVLSANDREILELSILSGYTYKEIAGRLSLNIGTVRSRLSRARERLRKEMMPMAGKRTTHLTKEIMERLLLRLANTEKPFSSEGLLQVAQEKSDPQVAKIAKGLARLVEEGEWMERAFYFTGSLSGAASGFVGFGQRWQKKEALDIAAKVLRLGLVQPDSPVSADEVATFCAYLSCLLQIGISISKAILMAGEQVPSLAKLANDAVENWREMGKLYRKKPWRKSFDDPTPPPAEYKYLADIFAEHPDIFTEAFVAAIKFGELYGCVYIIFASLAGYLWAPHMLDTARLAGNWEEKLKEGKKISQCARKVHG